MPSFPLAYASVFSMYQEINRCILIESGTRKKHSCILVSGKEKREIINNDEKEINKLKENIRKELKQETEKRKLPNDKTNMNLLTRLFALHFDRSFPERMEAACLAFRSHSNCFLIDISDKFCIYLS